MLADSLKLPTLFPALIFVGLNNLFIAPHLRYQPLIKDLVNRDLKDQALLIVILSIMLGYIINAIEVPIIRFYEGYPWRYSWLGRFLTACQLSRRAELERKSPSDLDYAFPSEEDVLPTKLGNVIAAFEAYPGRKYRMDGVTFWPRLFPILVKNEFATYIAEHRTTLDFLLNTSFLLGIFGLECILLRIFFFSTIEWALPLVSLVLAFVFYRAAISSAYNWGEMFRTGFDLFRYHLAGALGIKPVDSFDGEYVSWDSLTRFFLHPQARFDGFAYSKKAWPVDITRK